MLSEGRPGIDDKYSLKDGARMQSAISCKPTLNLPIGVLRIDLAKEKYERSGLVGKPIRDGGRKHMKTRYSKLIYVFIICLRAHSDLSC